MSRFHAKWLIARYHGSSNVIACASLRLTFSLFGSTILIVVACASALVPFRPRDDPLIPPTSLSLAEKETGILNARKEQPSANLKVRFGILSGTRSSLA